MNTINSALIKGNVHLKKVLEITSEFRLISSKQRTIISKAKRLAKHVYKSQNCIEYKHLNMASYATLPG